MVLIDNEGEGERAFPTDSRRLYSTDQCLKLPVYIRLIANARSCDKFEHRQTPWVSRCSIRCDRHLERFNGATVDAVLGP
jgi:hypothetical protein